MFAYLKRIPEYLKHPNLIIPAFDYIYTFYTPARYKYKNILKIAQNCEGLISPIEAVYLYKTILRNREIVGDILDFGSYKELSSCILSQSGKKIKKNVIAFESFKGLPSPNLQLEDGFFKEGEYKASKKEFIGNVNKYGISKNIKLIEGDATKSLKERIESKKLTQFSFAFIDVDLYASTKNILFLLDTITKGGEIICVHDIYSHGIKKAMKEFINHSNYRVLVRRQIPATCIAELIIRKIKK